NGATGGKIEIGMVGEIEHGGPVGAGGVLDRQAILVIEGVNHGHREIAGIPFLVIRADKRQPQAPILEFTFPYALVEALQPAMEMIRAVVGGQSVGSSLQFEAAASNPIRVAADNGAEIRVWFEVAIQGGEPAN